MSAHLGLESNLSINVVKNTFFETRVDIISKNGVRAEGIRAHNAFTAFFLKLLGKIDAYTDSEGITYYINKKSLINRSPDKQQAEACLNNLVQFVVTQIRECGFKKSLSKKPLSRLEDVDLVRVVNRKVMIEAANQALLENKGDIAQALYQLITEKTNHQYVKVKNPAYSEALRYLREQLQNLNKRFVEDVW